MHAYTLSECVSSLPRCSGKVSPSSQRSMLILRVRLGSVRVISTMDVSSPRRMIECYCESGFGTPLSDLYDWYGRIVGFRLI